MAKIILPAAFDHLSGTIKDVRYFRRNSYHCVANYKPYKQTIHSIKQKNQQKAFSIIISDFKYLKSNYPDEYKSWLEEAKVLEFKLQRTVTVVQLYTSFFLTKYQSELGQDVEPKILTGKGGFGTCNYGLGKFGVVTNCRYYHFKDRFLRKWLGF
ncbi:MAG: hypothetical protein OEV44_02710 [Spirochaetota bacterium]|nr:hypothetical protein [Spirochaetota bacterium]